MYTSYFWKAANEPEQGQRYVSISRSQGRGNHFEEYPALFPSWDIIKMAHDGNYSRESFIAYKKAYFAQLDALDAQKVYDDLCDATVVCFESARDIAAGKKWCHRRMVAGWIESRLGIVVPEELLWKDKSLIIPAIFE